jgi:hypothetical protein
MEISSFVRVPLVARHQLDTDLAAVGLAATTTAAAALIVAAAAPVGDDRHRLGHVRLDQLLELEQRLFGTLHAGADAELGVDVHLALVRLGQELDADHRIHPPGGHDQQHRGADHGRPVVEREVNGLAVALVHPLEETLADAIERTP